jgi:hypothetical protein
MSMGMIHTKTVWQWNGESYDLVSDEGYEYEGPLAETKRSKSPPPPPDPYQVAGAQTQQNEQSAEYNARINRMDQSNPYGSTNYQITGYDPQTGAPIYRQDTSLSSGLQGVFDQQVGNLQDTYSQPFSYNTDEARNNAESALYNRNTQYLDPQFERGENSLRTRMANQGVVEGSEAYGNAMQDFNRSKEQAYSGARNDAIAFGGDESSRALGQALQMRNQPMNEFSQFSGTVNPPNPGVPLVGTNPADIQGAMQNQYQGNLDIYNAKQSQRNALLQGAMGVGSAFLLSDERTKEEIEPLGELNDGTNIYAFQYKGAPDKHIGVMAQEVEKRDPRAVKEFGGLKHVNYARVLARALEAA